MSHYKIKGGHHPLLVLAVVACMLMVFVGCVDQQLSQSDDSELRLLAQAYSNIVREHVHTVDQKQLIARAHAVLDRKSKQPQAKASRVSQTSVKVLTPYRPEALAQDLLPAYDELVKHYLTVRRQQVNPKADSRSASLVALMVRDMVRGLDVDSAYYDVFSKQQLFASDGSDARTQLGLVLMQSGNDIIVANVLHRSPAARADITPGDRLLMVNDTDIAAMDMQTVALLLKGKPGSTLSLRWQTAPKQTKAAKLMRQVVQAKSVRGRLMPPNIAYLQIAGFETSTADDTKAELARLRRRQRHKLQGLILDLRNNTGGELTATVAVADLFLKKGLIVATKGRTAEASLRFNASPQGMDRFSDFIPIVVLINRRSAAAAEIVAAALQDHQRAVLVGERSLGRGSIQSLIGLHDGSLLKLTTAWIYRPAGETLEQIAVLPTICLVDPAASSLRRPPADQACQYTVKVSPHSGEDQALTQATDLLMNKQRYWKALGY